MMHNIVVTESDHAWLSKVARADTQTPSGLCRSRCRTLEHERGRKPLESTHPVRTAAA